MFGELIAEAVFADRQLLRSPPARDIAPAEQLDKGQLPEAQRSLVGRQAEMLRRQLRQLDHDRARADWADADGLVMTWWNRFKRQRGSGATSAAVELPPLPGVSRATEVCATLTLAAQPPAPEPPNNVRARP